MFQSLQVTQSSQKWAGPLLVGLTKLQSARVHCSRTAAAAGQETGTDKESYANIQIPKSQMVTTTERWAAADLSVSRAL